MRWACIIDGGDSDGSWEEVGKGSVKLGFGLLLTAAAKRWITSQGVEEVLNGYCCICST